MPSSKRPWIAAALVLAGFALLYRQVVVKLVMDWYNDDNYSHGFLIVPLALYFVWERREKLRKIPVTPNAFGLVFVLGSVALLIAGILGSELFLTRISILGTVVGVILFLFGWAHLRALAFPVAFLLLMIPIPAILFNQIAFPLQLLASQFGESAMGLANIPVLREGNVLILANTTLEVAEACSGIRSLVSLLTLAIVFGYFSDRARLGSHAAHAVRRYRLPSSPTDFASPAQASPLTALALRRPKGSSTSFPAGWCSCPRSC